MDSIKLKAHGIAGQMLRAIAKCLPLVFVLASPMSWATHVGLTIDNRGATPTVSTANSAALFLNSLGQPEDIVVSGATQLAPGRATVTSWLPFNQKVPVGNRAVVLAGFSTDILLLRALAPQDVQPDPAQEPFLIQSFTLDFYSDPIHTLPGFDAAALLSGFSVTEFRKTIGNTCPGGLFSDCAAAPDGSFDLTSELGNPPDTLRIVVFSNPASFFVPEPASVVLLAAGLLALGLSKPRRIRLGNQ